MGDPGNDEFRAAFGFHQLALALRIVPVVFDADLQNTVCQVHGFRYTLLNLVIKL